MNLQNSAQYKSALYTSGRKSGGVSGFLPRRWGFTLIELLVVIVILGIIAAIVIPSIASADDAQVISAARVLAADIEAAQSLGITTQVPHTLLFSTSLQQYKVVADYDGTSGYGAVSAIAHPARPGSLYEVTLNKMNGMDNVQTTDVDFGGKKYVTFNEIGEPSTGGSVSLAAGKKTATVQVEPITGTVSASAD